MTNIRSFPESEREVQDVETRTAVALKGYHGRGVLMEGIRNRATVLFAMGIGQDRPPSSAKWLEQACDQKQVKPEALKGPPVLKP